MATRIQRRNGAAVLTSLDSIHARQQHFLKHLERHFALAPAARAAGFARETIYDWLATDPAFKQAFKECREAAIDTLEGSFFQDAVKGHTVKAITMLRAHRDGYQEHRTEPSGPVQQVQIVYDNNPPQIHAAPTTTIVTIGDAPVPPRIDTDHAMVLLPEAIEPIDASPIPPWAGE